VRSRTRESGPWKDVYEVAPAITFPCEWPRPEPSRRGLVPGGYFLGAVPGDEHQSPNPKHIQML